MWTPLTEDERADLEATARRVRERIVKIVWASGSGHVGAALSQADALVALHARYLRLRPGEPRWPDRDRFVLSKGHGGLGLVAVLAERGFLPEADLDGFGQSGHPLGMHLDWRKVPGVEVSTGSLGHGLGVSVGLALGARHQGFSWRTVCLLSDGELYEGSVWEALLSAPAFKLGRLCAIVDRNRLTMDGFTEREVPLEPLGDKLRAFGWRVFGCDGHDYRSLCAALDEALGGDPDGPPSIVVAETIKGKGVPFMENEAAWHYGSLDSALYATALAAVRGGA
jgi:transketolase